ncbi:MAG: DUF3808 domain-containing protein [Ignavibacteria bacterium]|nr:DUF3808 domain-containing protein [Ignavibacteria bacterium]
MNHVELVDSKGNRGALASEGKMSAVVRRSQALTVFTLLVLQSLPAQTPPAIDWGRVHDVTMEGIEFLYNFRFREAEQKFESVIRIAPRDPRGHFFKAMIYSYRYAFFRKREDFDKFIVLSDNVIVVSGEILKRDKKNSTALFYIGGIYGYRGIVRSIEGQLVRAVWDGRKGYGYLEDAVKNNPANADAEMGLGLFNYMISQIPASFRWIVKLMGFGGDRGLGLEQLERAATKGLYARNEARQWLSQFLQQEEEYERAFQLIDQLASAYPQNPFYELYRGNSLLYRLRRADAALASYQRATAIENAEAEYFINAAIDQIGDVYRYRNDFPEAIKWYSAFVAVQNADTSTQSRARYWIGFCYELMGDRQRALSYYKSVPHVRGTEQRITTPLTKEEIEIEKLNNFYSAGEYTKVVEGLHPLLMLTNLSPQRRAGLLLLSGRTRGELKDPENALKAFEAALAIALPKDSPIPPNCYYERGLIHRKNGRKDLAKLEFEKALTFSDFAGERWFKQRVERELKRLEQ